MQALLTLLVVFAGALLAGYIIISRVPPLLHTPLMSLTNAVSAVTVLGALLVFEEAPGVVFGLLGAIALATGTFNVVGGFAITERMLKMFKKH